MTLPIVGKRISGLLLTCLALAGGCRRESDTSRTADSVVAAHAPPPSPSNTPPKDTVSGAGRLTWTLADLETRLRDNGLDATRRGTITQPFMGPPGVVYRITSGELQAYIYADADAVARDTDKLDTTRVSPPNMMINWVMPPSLITENNLAVILLTRDRALRVLVKRAIAAKPTQHREGRP